MGLAVFRGEGSTFFLCSNPAKKRCLKELLLSSNQLHQSVPELEMVAVFEPTETKGELREALLESLTGDKVNECIKDLALRLGLQSLSLGLIVLINEGKAAEALAILYFLHKQDIVLWFNCTSCLLGKASNHANLAMAASIIKASSKPSLSESFVETPGLYGLARRENFF